MFDYQKAYEIYQMTNLKRPFKKHVENILRRKFKAIEIPLYSIDKANYKNDEEVNEKHIYKLLTITNPEVLANLYSEDEKKENEELKLLEKEMEAQEASDVPDDEVVYNTIIEEHNNGFRVSVVLEGKRNIITNFKVYGNTEYLNTYLIAIIGLKNMALGDLNNDDFKYYLECLAKHDFI